MEMLRKRSRGEKPSKIIVRVITITLLGISINVQTQNLVPNPSFELYNQCPTAFSQFPYIKNWFNPLSPSWSTPDYFNACAMNGQVGVPSNFAGYQDARTGNAYTGVYDFSTNDYREYISVRLTQTLIAGKSYCVEMYVSRAEKKIHNTNRFGIYFSTDSLSGSMFGYIPQIQNPPGTMIADRDNWVKISGTFFALGGEQFITIGNFYDNASTTYQVATSTGSTGGSPGGYLYIDDVSVIEEPTIEVSDNTSVCEGQEVALSAGGGVAYLWDNGNSEKSITVFPNTTTDYMVDITGLCGNITTKVINVSVIPQLTVKANDDVIIKPGEIIILSATGAINYNWSPSNTLSCSTCSNPMASPQETTKYYVVSMDENVCNDMDSVTVYVNHDLEIYVPNAVTPNADGLNDELWVYYNTESLTGGNIKIYDRWGELVYEGDLSKSWNCKNKKGEFVQMGVYVYQLNYSEKGEAFQKKGKISVVR